MDIKVIGELLKRIHELLKETSVLYEISETEKPYITQIIIDAHGYGLSPKLTAKLLKAAAHIIESSEDVIEKATKDLIK